MNVEGWLNYCWAQKIMSTVLFGFIITGGAIGYNPHLTLSLFQGCESWTLGKLGELDDELAPILLTLTESEAVTVLLRFGAAGNPVPPSDYRHGADRIP